MDQAEYLAQKRQRERESAVRQKSAAQPPVTSSAGGEWQRNGYHAVSNGGAQPDAGAPGLTQSPDPHPERAERRSFGVDYGD